MIRQLNIFNYETYIIIGNDDSERKDRRKVIVDISLRFMNENSACLSDDIGETVCYADLVAFVQEKLQYTKFRLLERITQYLYDEISFYLRDQPDILKYVKITKVAPPVENLKNASFVCSDW
ncbi:MAG: dihydroneopterin aldolase [Holosporaceae bacterium]|jgi:dihydroneopterin aldolase|nr:dihydroneopterin aldolase [Holosporaceae bacterium]